MTAHCPPGGTGPLTGSVPRDFLLYPPLLVPAAPAPGASSQQPLEAEAHRVWCERQAGRSPGGPKKQNLVTLKGGSRALCTHRTAWSATGCPLAWPRGPLRTTRDLPSPVLTWGALPTHSPISWWPRGRPGPATPPQTEVWPVLGLLARAMASSLPRKNSPVRLSPHHLRQLLRLTFDKKNFPFFKKTKRSRKFPRHHR